MDVLTPVSGVEVYRLVRRRMVIKAQGEGKVM
jgi:hypothetical protein